MVKKLRKQGISIEGIVIIIKVTFDLVFCFLLICPVSFVCLICHLLFFFKIIFFFENSFRNMPSECQTVQIQILLTGPDLGPDCLQNLSADGKS